MSKNNPLEEVQEFSRDVVEKFPVIVLGSGASAAHGVPGMWPLGQHLQSLGAQLTWSPDEIQEWSNFRDQINAGVDLEGALGSVRLSEDQTSFVVQQTRDFLIESDLRAFSEILANRRALPLSILYDHLFRTTRRTIDVLTTNYDRIAEYAADAAGHSHFTGFEYGHLQHRAKDPKLRITSGGQVVRTVCVWKVHGSLDWFKDSKNQTVSVRSATAIPAGMTAMMVTPGIDKYRITHGEPFRTVFACADQALMAAQSYFCVGYGFNDEHVQSKLVERCESSRTPLLLITQKVSVTARKFLSRGLCQRYLALEQSDDGTLAFSDRHPAGVNLTGEHIWQLPIFLDRVLGVTR